jgi:5-methylcytosine-specific restriction enzyme A
MAGLYGYAWQQARAGFLAEHPLCCYCERVGKLTASTIVDHIVPHKGDVGLFWDQANWQALCKRCHDALKQKEEHGRVVGCDASGVPMDATSHWYARG